MVEDGRRGEALADRGANERKILVMLHLAPPHFRPEAAYTGSYDSRFGRDDRRRVADALAREHNLKLVTDWPIASVPWQRWKRDHVMPGFDK